MNEQELHIETPHERACAIGLILRGFTVEDEHSIVLCARGREWYYSKRRVERRGFAARKERHRD